MKTKESGASQPLPFPGVQPAHTSDAIDADQLFHGRKEIVIRHGRDRYVLRITRHGKLILNK